MFPTNKKNLFTSIIRRRVNAPDSIEEKESFMNTVTHLITNVRVLFLPRRLTRMMFTVVKVTESQ